MQSHEKQIVEALNRREWKRAEQLSAQILHHSPDRDGVHFLAGIAAMEQQEIQTALTHFERACALDPNRPDYLVHLARTLSVLQRLGDAIAAADRALAMAPSDPLMLDTLGVVYTQCNAHDRAADAFGRAVKLAPDNAGFRFNLGVSLTFHGDMAEAERQLEACIAIDPRHGRAHHSLSQLRKQTHDANHVDRLRALLPQAVASPTASLYLHMALAKELEDLGQIADSFAHLVAGKSAPRHLLKYASGRDAELFDALAAAFPTVQALPDGAGTNEPIFIVGMPRTGTTLIDRIVSSHSDVHSAGELHNFAVAWKRALGGPTFRMFNAQDISRAKTVDWRALGEAYVASTRPITGHTARFTDKLPHNFLYLGFIARALPNARLICVRRNPMDTCLSNFRQLFAPESPYFDYSYDLLDTGRYYLMFDRLMAHWNAVFPGRILQVQYESVVEDLDGNARRLVDFCGLPWEEGCLRFEQNAAPVTTASAAQVRAPIYRSALDRWKQYEKQLEPLRQLLLDAGVNIDR